MVFSILFGGVAGVCFLGFCFWAILDRFAELEHVQRSERSRLLQAWCKAQAEREQQLRDDLHFERWAQSRLSEGDSKESIERVRRFDGQFNTIVTKPVIDPSKVW